MGLLKEKLRVTTERSRGAFGMKSAHLPEYPGAAGGCAHDKRPVHWMATRSNPS